MAKQKAGKYNLDLIVSELESVKSVDKDGKVAYRGFLVDHYFSLIETSIQFSEEVPEVEKRRIIIESLFSPAARQKLTGRSLIAEISKRERQFLTNASKSYILATSLSIPNLVKPGRLSIDGSTITFSSTLPAHFDRAPLEQVFSKNSHMAHPPNYTAARVRVMARYTSEGFDKAMDNLDFIRGIWNFRINRLQIRFSISAIPKPINEIRLGQVHTLHNEKGILIDQERYWYEPHFVFEEHGLKIVTKWPRIKQEEKTIRRHVKGSSYAADLKLAFIRYVRALDSTDFESSYLKLWSLLEFLTHSEGRYDDLTRRSSFVFKNPEFERQVLEHLRERRNSYVHAGRHSSYAESLTVQLKRYVESLLMFHLRSTGRFSSIADAATYLDLPCETNVLRQRISRYRMALKFRGDSAGNK